jgi:transposase
VPRQYTTGGKERLLGMSKRGDTSLRKLLVHGARATIRWVGRKTDRRSQWMRQLLERRGTNRTAVAVANTNARIVWALLTSHQDYQPATSEGEDRHAYQVPQRGGWEVCEQFCDVTDRSRSPSAPCEV